MYDVAIIGAGVIGCSIAKELAEYDIKLAVLEAQVDVAMGATGANSGILHAGHDCETGTLMARFNIKGNEMFDKICQDLDVPYQRCGSLVLAFNQEEINKLEILKTRGINNGLKEIKIIKKDKIYKLEPKINSGVIAALWTPTAGIINPYELNVALMEISKANGAEYFFEFNVDDIKTIKAQDDYYFEIYSSKGNRIKAKCVVNCAGVYADQIASLVGDNSFYITPRRGEYIIFDRPSPVNRPIFQVPTKMGKGVLVSPTVDGNFFIGPSAQDISDKSDKSVTIEGIHAIKAAAAKTMSDLPYNRQISSFAGLRAIPSVQDFVIGESVPNFFNAAGICSPGLTSAPAIAEHLAEQICQKYGFKKKKSCVKTRRRIINFKSASNQEKIELIKKDIRYSNVICRCEVITEAEIVEAVRRGASTVDGVKRRTRATMGRCQGSFCMPKILEIMSRELGVKMQDITKFGGNSYIIAGDIRGESNDTKS
ncbi:MAG TPA: NAD(P)/FAD-dependent oxidoreductase [Clostridia bacterium]